MSKIENQLRKPFCGKETCEAYVGIVDELKRANKLAKKLDIVLDSSYDGIYITDGNAITMRVNKAYERITGIKQGAILGKNINVLVEQGIISKACTTLVLENKEAMTIQQKLASGKVVLVTGTPIFDENNEIEMVVNNVRDVTELLELKEALKENELKMNLYNSELEQLRRKMNHPSEVFSRNVKMKKLMESATRAAKHDTTVLISGETGVGKEIMAKFIHQHSDRCNEKLVKVNCSAIPENLMESEFFGYEKGAFTGANVNGKIGLFEEANGGTIFLDEIGELPINLQSKMLRVLQEQELQRVGSVETVKINVRVIAATNQDLMQRIEQGLFRKDLFYRLNIIPLHVLALRDRIEDLIPLANDFLEKLNLLYGENKKFAKEVYKSFGQYNWPGNIRELRNVIERVFVMTEGQLIQEKDLPVEVRTFNADNTVALEGELKLKEAVGKLEYAMIQDAFKAYGNVRDAARSLGIDGSTFVRKRTKYLRELSLEPVE
ncbi:sigma-54-dependent Fis family transcriptional regulator [Fusibacter sp. 3D3]|uniref:sigma-54 interaction domain-containing protein n=1 Tax=Fusibacter sp. 3D3 TaxID=1048380 RepID=UPI00085921B2|nr:sigma 54-interacting transcriptional regulator [Fusibacter sp. 3D3]GAU79603.1 response regulator of zinc sigma-54-dependent two-component system [Fusibacter sp. 3D3]